MEEGFGTILIDISDGAAADFDRDLLERMGHPVVVCHGPPHASLCPILGKTGCPKVDEAHGIIFELDLDRPQHRAILKRYREVVAEDVPIAAVVRPGQDTEYADILHGISVYTRALTSGELDGFAAEVEAYDRIAP